MKYQEQRTKLFKELKELHENRKSFEEYYNDPRNAEYAIVSPKAVDEFIRNMNFKPLIAFVKKHVKVDLTVNPFDKRVEMFSHDLADRIGLMSLSFKTVRLETFDSTVSTKEAELSYWGSLHFSYENFEGGKNGNDVLRMWYKDGKWKIRTVSENVLYELDEKGNTIESKSF